MSKQRKELVRAIQKGERPAIAKAITLVESTRAEDRQQAEALLKALGPGQKETIRIGITGIPGVGKSTFIQAFGLYLLQKGKKVGVLTVDPSSERTKGSILGDKTRMPELSQKENAFIRPSPTSGKLGGVNPHTREAIMVLEAAGYDVILVETVGAGQSETEVAHMVDLFMVLQIPGAGDELQGIKKGVFELADLIVINKAEKENKNKALLAVRDVNTALKIITGERAGWTPPVLMCSALEGTGIAEIWQKILEFQKIKKTAGQWAEKRAHQALYWMKAIIEDRLLWEFLNDPETRKRMPGLEAEVRTGKTTPSEAANLLLEAFRKK